tara:strand:+ start:780 stop:1268 length:489 start_codon:yes stop_codon:yes gene_type:complete
MQVIDDALDKEYFKHLDKQMLHQNRFKWLFQEKVATLEDDPDDEQFYFISSFYHNLMVEDDFYYELRPLFDALGVKALIRCRAIMYMNQGKIIKHKPHIDFEYSHNAALLYMNTNNGYTGMMNDDKVESVENRILLHDGSIPHYSTTCTDTCKRIVLAVNYF